MNISQKIISALCAAYILAVSGGCASVRPPETAASVLGNPAAIADFRADTAWWIAYNDPQLNSLMATALERNADVAKSLISIRKALYQANLVGADLLPEFSLVGDIAVGKDIKSGTSPVRTFGGTLAVSYELDLWNRISNAVTSKEFKYYSSIEDHNALKLILINNIIDSYFHLFYLHSAISETNNIIKNSEIVLDKIKIKYNFGKVSSHEPQVALQSLLSQKQKLMSLEFEQKKTLNALYLLLNTSSEGTPAFSFKEKNILDLQLLDVDLNIPISFLANRPDIKSIEYKLRSAFYDTKSTQRALYPSITVGSSLSSYSSNFKNALSYPFLAGLISINFPFLDWSRIKWDIKLTEAEYDNIRIEFEHIISAALNELDLAHFNYLKSKEYFSVIKDIHAVNKRISAFYEKRYEQGRAEIKDWLDAKNTELESKLQLLKAYYEIVVYENTIYKVMAGRHLRQ